MFNEAARERALAASISHRDACLVALLSLPAKGKLSRKASKNIDSAEKKRGLTNYFNVRSVTTLMKNL